MRRFPFYRLGLTLLIAVLTAVPLHAQGGYDPTVQSPDLFLNEARTVHLGNLARRDNGVPPLRWSRSLTCAARWFSWDSTENRPTGFCGHQDTLGGWPGDRARRFGYGGSAGAENAFCGYVTPEYAIWGWMNSEGHRRNLLDPNSREVGLGYYRRSDGRGYVTQDFGTDPAYAPVVIEYEAITTTSPTVSLYIYDRAAGGGFAGMSPATAMMVAEDPCFLTATWEPYRPNRTWTFTGPAGWRTIHVRTRDAFSRTMTVSDTIYLGTDVPLGELDRALTPPPQSQVTLYCLTDGEYPYVQFSLGWLADDTFETFGKLWGNGERVTDPDAWGGTAFRLFPGNGESSAWIWDTTFIKDTPFVAYLRLKVNRNTSSGEVARVSVKGGGTEYGPLRLRGTDFAAPNRYQEFALPFTFHSNPNDPFLIFQFWRSGDVDLYVDAVSIFTVAQPATSPFTWTVPGGNYRGRGIWVRYTDSTPYGPHFSLITEGKTFRYLYAVPSSLAFMAQRGGPSPSPVPLTVVSACASLSWQASASAPWIHLQVGGNVVRVGVNPSGLGIGVHSGAVTLTPIGAPDVPLFSVPVVLVVAEQIHHSYLPLVRR